MKKVLMAIIILSLLGACNDNDNTGNEQNDAPNNESEDNNQESNESEETDNEDLTEEKAQDVLLKFNNTFNAVIDNTTAEGEVQEFNSKQELASHFTGIMSSDLANEYVETYFEERDGSLFVTATDGPISFQKDIIFTLDKVNEQEYMVIQNSESELTGKIKSLFTLDYHEGNWRVKSIEHRELNTTPDDAANSEEKAISLVKESLDLSEDTSTKVKIDRINENENYVVHVYDVVEHENGSHTATIGWYTVNVEEETVEDMM